LGGNGTFEVSEAVNQPHAAHMLKLDISKSLNTLTLEAHIQRYQSIENVVHEYKELGRKYGYNK
jgi:hypothetical protein